MQAARDVPDPKRGGSVGAAWESRQRTAWAQQTPVDLSAKEDARSSPRLSPLGSGSDYTVVPRSSRRPVVRLRVRRRLRRLSLGLRQLPLDGEVRRSRVPVSRGGGEALGADGDAPGQRRRGAAALLAPTRAICGWISTRCAATRSAARARPWIRRSGAEGADHAGLRGVLAALQELRSGGRGRRSRRRCGVAERRRRGGAAHQRRADPGRARVPRSRKACRIGRGSATC